MKAVLSGLLTLTLVTGVSSLAFAEGTATTDQTSTSTGNTALTAQQQQQRDNFLKVYYDDLNQLVSLRQQTQSAAEANHTLVGQIKDKVKAKAGIDPAVLSQLKDLASQKKSLITQVKQLHTQRLSLKSQYRDAVKAKDVEKMKTLEQQMLDLNSQITTLKSKNDAFKAQIAPLKAQLKTMRDERKQVKGDVNSKLQQAKNIHNTIKTQQQEKTNLWNTYKENIKNKDYSAAEATFKQIIDKKAAILDNIKQMGTAETDVLSSLNV